MTLCHLARTEGLVNRITDSPDKKRTLEFVGEIEAMIDNDPSKLIRSMSKDMEVCEFLQAEHEDILYFLYKMRKGQFLSQVMKDRAVKLLRWRRYASIHLPTWPQIQHMGLHQVPGEDSAALDREGGWW